MKYIKTYESKNTPKIGDYVICKDSLFHDDSPDDKDMIDFLSDNVGQIIDIDDDEENKKYNYSKGFIYIIEYHNIPDSIKSNFDSKIKKGKRTIRAMSKKEILLFSPDKEELEAMIAVKKYNL